MWVTEFIYLFIHLFRNKRSSQSQDTADLYKIVLERIEDDNEKDKKGNSPQIPFAVTRLH